MTWRERAEHVLAVCPHTDQRGNCADCIGHEIRRAIGIEVEERYCEIAARRLSQQVLSL